MNKIILNTISATDIAPLLVLLIFLIPCQMTKAANFEEDSNFLHKHIGIVVLHDRSGKAEVLVVPAWQGRVMTSTACGPKGDSFGWVNRELIASGKLKPHINAFGGEDRFWLGPEGGQFALFFAPGVPFDLAHWFTPTSLDTEPFTVVSQCNESVQFHREIMLTNYSGTRFELAVDRKIQLISAKQALAEIGAPHPAGVSAVAYESVNAIKNTGAIPWTRSTGELSIWILGQFNASDQSTVVIPFKPGSESERGIIMNDSYFGKVPADRLVAKDGVLFFCADAKFRCKIGIPPRRARSVLGSYDAVHHTLTLVKFTLPPGVTDYVNSMWKLQTYPFSGDVVNSYNDDGNLGCFYELESSSPALALAPEASATHRSLTIHLQGSEKDLDAIARAALGVNLNAIQNAFGN